MLTDGRSELGATAVFVAGALVLLMGSAAIAIDIGAGFNERRQAQSAADFGALAAAAFATPDDTPAECNAGGSAQQRAACRGAVEAIEVVAANLPGRSINWAQCSDPEPDPDDRFPVTAQVRMSNGVPSSGGTLTDLPCIRFTASTQGVRVVVPSITIATTFGRVIGANSITTRAAAEVMNDLQFKILPFGVPSNAADHYDCVKASANPNWGVCHGSITNGNFGYMDIPTYGNPSMGTSYDNCNPTNPTLVSNLVRGVDHPLGFHESGEPTPDDLALRDRSGNDTELRKYVCPIFGSNANEIGNQPGDRPVPFDQGMTYGYGVAERGRLWETNGGISVRNSGGNSPATVIDNTPLWQFFTTPGFCPTGSGPLGPIDSTELVYECLDSWVAGDSVIFRDEIQSAKRFAYAPRLHVPFSNASYYFIEELVAMYLQTSYWDCSAGGGQGSAGRCNIIHNPGEPGTDPCPNSVPASTPPGNEDYDSTCGVPGSQNQLLSGITAFRFLPGMLPESARPPTSGAAQTALALSR